MLKISKSPTRELVGGRSNRFATVMRKIRKTAVFLILIVILGGGAAFGYIWFMGLNSKPVVQQAVAQNVQAQEEAPKKVNQYKTIGVAIQYIDREITAGDTMSFSVHTNREATCTLEVLYDSGNSDMEFNDAGLKPKVSDEYGAVTWKWTVPATAPKGEASADATCANKKNWAHVVGDFIVK